MTKILVLGKTGQLARAIRQLADNQNQRVIPGLEFRFLDRQACDLTSSEDEINATLNQHDDTQGIIVAAAYTAVDQAETDFDTALAVNAHAPGIIARYCAIKRIPLVHVSTDYVFDGNGQTPWHPEDPVAPINAYGRSKRAGENAIIESKAEASILRTSWVFDGTGKNFLTTMMRLGQTRENLSIVDDQIGRPTYAGHLAHACVSSLQFLRNNSSQTGTQIYHVSDTGEPISWAKFAHEIFEIGAPYLPRIPVINAIPSVDYPTPAKRPAYSVMNVEKFENTHGTHLPNWRLGLRRAILEWQSANTNTDRVHMKRTALKNG